MIITIFSFREKKKQTILIENLSSIENNNTSLSHEDSIYEFIEWYEAMTEKIISIDNMSDFKEIGPQQMSELESRFSNWHIKLSDIDKDNIKYCVKKSLRKLVLHSLRIADENGMQFEQPSEDQINFMIHIGECGTDLVLDTTTYLDYFVLWTKDHYNPPINQ